MEISQLLLKYIDNRNNIMSFITKCKDLWLVKSISVFLDFHLFQC